MVRNIGGIPRPIGGDKPPKGTGAAAGVAVAIVLAAVAGGGAGSIAATSGAADEFRAGARTSQSQDTDEFSVNAKTSRGRTEVRIRGSDDGLRATFRLRKLGQHPTRFESESTRDCAYYSDG